MVFFNYASIFLFSVYFIQQLDANLQPDFKLIRSGYFREYENVIPYETTAKAVFKVALPTNSVTPPDAACQLTNVPCRIKQTLFQIYHENVRMLKTIVQANRKERQLGVLAVGVTGGILLSSVFSRFSHGLFGSESDAEMAISKLRTAMEHNNREALLFQHDVRSFALNITDSTINLRRQQQDILTVLDLLEVNAMIRNNWVNLEIGLQSCFSRHVPITLIAPNLLRNTLAGISGRAHLHGLRLSLASKNIEKYYKINIADCFLTESSLYIMINVPLTKRNWKIAQLIPVPFASHNLTCHLGTKVPVTIAADGDIITMDPYMNQFCDIHQYQLCLVPSLSTRSNIDICLKSLYYGKDGTNSSQYCQFECVKSSHPTTFEVTPSVIVVTNGHSLTTTCGSMKKEYHLGGAGAVEVKLRCNCSYNLDGRILHSGMTCANGSHEFHDVVNVLPEIWAKISVRNMFMQPPEKTTVMNTDWVLHAPNVRDLIVPEPFNNFRLDLNGSSIIFLGILVALLTVGFISLALCYCKLLKL